MICRAARQEGSRHHYQTQQLQRYLKHSSHNSSSMSVLQQTPRCDMYVCLVLLLLQTLWCLAGSLWPTRTCRSAWHWTHHSTHTTGVIELVLETADCIKLTQLNCWHAALVCA